MKKPRKYKILMLLSTFGVASGVNSFAMNYLRNIDHKKVQIDFAVYFERESPYIEEIHAYGGKTFLLPPIQHFRDHYKVCEKILDTGDYDVIHDNSLILTIPFMLIAQKKGVPLRILHSHSTELGEDRLKKIRNRIMLPILKEAATNYVACSSRAGNAMFKRKPYVVIPNVITADQYRFNEEERKVIRHKMKVEGSYVIATDAALDCESKEPIFCIERV